MDGATAKRKVFDIPIKNSLIEPKHYKRMGDSVWLFLWAVDHVTREVINATGERIGIVFGNMPQRDEDIAGDIGCSVKTIRRWRNRCIANDYIGIRRTPYGFSMWVRHSKKWAKEPSEQRVSDRQIVSALSKRDLPKTGAQSCRYRTHRSADSGKSNKTLAMTSAMTQQRAVAGYASLQDLPTWLQKDAKEACWQSFNDWDEPPKNPDAYFAKHWRDFARRVVQNHCEDVNTQHALDIQADYGKLSDEEARELAELNRTRARWKALLQKLNSPDTEVRV